MKCFEGGSRSSIKSPHTTLSPELKCQDKTFKEKLGTYFKYCSKKLPDFGIKLQNSSVQSRIWNPFSHNQKTLPRQLCRVPKYPGVALPKTIPT
jgi:hypothetical protein